MPKNIPQEVIKTPDKTLKFWICLLGLAFVLGGDQFLLHDNMRDTSDRMDRYEAGMIELKVEIARLTRGQEEFLRRLE